MDLRKIQNEAIATLNAAQTMLNRFPSLDNVSVNYSLSTNPIPFLLNIFKSMKGYDEIITWLARTVSIALPGIEVAVKAVLLSNIRNLLTCSFNPMIDDELLLNGIVFPVEQIDTMNILDCSPIRARTNPPRVEEIEVVDQDGKPSFVERVHTFVDTYQPDTMLTNIFASPYGAKASVGSYYYFGCDNMSSPYELENAGDFNAFLWFIKNKALYRTAWHGVNLKGSLLMDSSYSGMGTGMDSGLEQSYFTQKQPKDDDFYETNDKKDKKGAGIITLDYKDNVSSLKNAEGGDLTVEMPPYTNVLHVLLGNAAPRFNKDQIEAKDNINRLYDDLSKENYKLEKIVNEIYDLKCDLKKLKKEYKKMGASGSIESEVKDAKKAEIDKLEKEINNKNTAKDTGKNAIEERIKEISSDIKISEANFLKETPKYNDKEKNYYYRRTLVEFNYDYIMSLKLFDAKVVVAQLIDALTGCFSFDLNLSFEQRIIKEETQRIVESVIESDEAIISDCFFKFTNEGYNEMLRKVELMQSGVVPDDKGMPSGVSMMDARKILAALDDISEGASEEKIQSAIETGMFYASGLLTDRSERSETDFSLNANIVENVLSQLAYILVSIVLSPKLYLLMAVNLKILGKNTALSPKEFITNYRTLFVAIIRMVRDQLLGYLYDFLKKLIIDLSVGEAKLLAQEQIDYYKRLLRKCIECFRMNRQNLDFSVDNVNYADILDEDRETDTDSNNC